MKRHLFKTEYIGYFVTNRIPTRDKHGFIRYSGMVPAMKLVSHKRPCQEDFYKALNITAENFNKEIWELEMDFGTSINWDFFKFWKKPEPDYTLSIDRK